MEWGHRALIEMWGLRVFGEYLSVTSIGFIYLPKLHWLAKTERRFTVAA